MVGRKQKPENLKVLQGTNRPDRVNNNAPVPVMELPQAPMFLNVRARQIFDELVQKIDEMGYASVSHSEMLGMTALRLEQVERYTQTITDEGSTYETTNQNDEVIFKKRPEVDMLSEAMRHAQSLLAEFGLSPATMGKVSVGKPKDKGNKWADLGGVRKTG